MKILIKISLLLFICSGTNPVYALSLSSKHKTALKIECKQAIEDGLFISKNKCYAEKTILIDQYGYAWTDKLNDKTLARKIQLQCHILIDDGIFKYNQCIEKKVNRVLGIVKEEQVQPPVEYSPNNDTNKKDETLVPIEVVKSTIPEASEIYNKLKNSVMLVRTIHAKNTWTDEEIVKAPGGTCSAVALGVNQFATNAHCVLFGKEKNMSEHQISDFICLLSIANKISGWEGCNWAIVEHIDAFSDQAIILIHEYDLEDKIIPTPVQIKKSKSVNIFDKVYTLGNPEGNIGVFTEGKITAINEWDMGGSYEIPTPMYTIDAIIEPGNSGGGLFDINGNLIGITSGGMPDRAGKKSVVQHNYAIVIDEFLNLLN